MAFHGVTAACDCPGNVVARSKSPGPGHSQEDQPVHISSHLPSRVRQLQPVCPSGRGLPGEIQQWQLGGSGWKHDLQEDQPTRPGASHFVLHSWQSTDARPYATSLRSAGCRPLQLPAFVRYAAKARVELGQSCQHHRNQSSRRQRSARERANSPKLPSKRAQTTWLVLSSSCRNTSSQGHIPTAAMHISHAFLMRTHRLFSYNNFRHPALEHL